jgi:hypothetical protein
VVGADFLNKRGPTRRFEIALCVPGEAVDLVREPKNPADPRAVAVFSNRGVQIGYLTAERCGWIGTMIERGQPLTAVFQEKTDFGAVIRVALDGGEPVLPPPRPAADQSAEDDFWPDYIPPDD